MKAFHVAPVAETVMMVRIECSPTPGQEGAKLDAAQLGMSPQHALQLAEDLRKTAEHILALPRLEKTH